MAAVVGTVLVGLLLGLSLAAPPGPMNAIIAEESVVRGWPAGVRAGLGAMSSDALFFVLAVAGAATIVEELPLLETAMLAVGGLLMLYFALGAVRNAETTFSGDRPDGAQAGFRNAFVLGVTNPYQILWWLTVGVGFLTGDTADPLAHAPYVGDSLAGLLVVEPGAALIGGFFGGIALWITGFPAALTWAERRADAFAPTVAALSALLLAAFGVWFLADAATTLVG